MSDAQRSRKPNVVFVFADQWRAQATGYAGNLDVRSPNLDRLAGESVNFVNAVSGCPVCSPYRASLITGRFPLTHGVFLNDARLSDDAVSIAQAFSAGGYRTGYIGKWHLDGPERSGYIPPERRQGFEYWKVLNCTHGYMNSRYYAGDSDELLSWDGYDAAAQTEDAADYIRRRADADEPFLLMLSWGPPHAPYRQVPERYLNLFDPEQIALRENVPEQIAEAIRPELAGYYAHIAAMDDCLARLLDALREAGIEEDTIFVVTSDHGDMLGSRGARKKQSPWEESIRVPFLLRWPGGLGRDGRTDQHVIDAPDIMPTLLSLCGLPTPQTVEGRDLSDAARGRMAPEEDEAALLMCVVPFCQWNRDVGGREYRGLRTTRHTYVRDRNGPWLLFDDEADPCQLRNLVDEPGARTLRDRLDALLDRRLAERGDEFLSAEAYIERWGYSVDELLQIPYKD